MLNIFRATEFFSLYGRINWKDITYTTVLQMLGISVAWASNNKVNSLTGNIALWKLAQPVDTSAYPTACLPPQVWST